MIGVLLAGPGTASYAAPLLQATPTPTPDPVSTFEDVTDEAGVAFTGAQFGVSWGDFDNDGWVDLFVNNHFQDNPNVYHNDADGTFTDIYTSSLILSAADSERDPPVGDPHGSRWGDYDDDGDLDLYITTGRLRINPLYENHGDGTFAERALEAGVEDLAGRGRTANWIDYDRDGDLDLFKGNEIRVDGPDKLYRNNGDGTFDDVSDIAGLNDTSGTWGNVWGDYNGDGDMDVMLTGGDGVKLYRNNGDGTFTEVTSEANLVPWEDKSWGADFGDYDNDGDLDLYVARGNYSFFDHVKVSTSVITYAVECPNGYDGFDFESTNSRVTFDTLGIDGNTLSTNQVYVGATKQHPATIPFTLGTGSVHYGQPSYTPGSDTGVFIWQDGPGGTWHLRVSNMWDAQGRLDTNGNFFNVVNVGLESFNPPPKPNRLYRNLGDGTFEEVGAIAGVNSVRGSRTGTWGDYNNDGWLDLYVINSGDVEIGNEANHLYRNNGDGTFSDVADEARVEAVTPGLGDCAAWADYDHNGFLDLFVATDGNTGYLGGPHKLYRNLGNGNHWLEINLIGTFSNRQGVGTQVDVLAGDISQTRPVNNGSHYLCQNNPVLHFGLGGASYADVITVTWPSGLTQALRQVAADQILTITEDESLAINQSVVMASVEPGTHLTYTITVINQPTAAYPATDVVVTDFLPSGTTFVDAGFVSPVSGAVHTEHIGPTGAISWTISNPVPVAGHVQLYLTVHTPYTDATVVTNTCQMTSGALLDPVWDTLVATITSGPQGPGGNIYLPLIFK